MSEPIDEVPTAVDTSEPDEEQILDMGGVRKLRTENQRLRHKLREVEANRASEVEANLAKIAEYEKREAERAAGSVLIDGEDIWRYTDEATQAEFNDEFGRITAGKVVEAAQALAAERPHLARTQRPPSSQPIEGLRSGAMPAQQKKPVTWSSALGGR